MIVQLTPRYLVVIMALISMRLIFCLNRIVPRVPAITYHKDVAPIIANRCYPCHASNVVGMLKLTNYAQVKKFSGIVKYALQSGFMPPWYADSTGWSFSNHRYITEEEKNTVLNCIAIGMPLGTAADSFDIRLNYSAAYRLADYILKPTRPVRLIGGTEEIYEIVNFDINIPGAQNIAAVEIRSSVPSYAHHALYRIQVPGKNVRQHISEMEVTLDSSCIMAGGWAPGWQPIQFPAGFGFDQEMLSLIIIGTSYRAGDEYIQWPFKY